MSRDKSFELFVDTMGEADSRESAPWERIEQFRGRIPDKLLEIWSTEGWASYGGGLIWTVDPARFQGLLSMWCEGTPYSPDEYHVIARTAFGTLYAYSMQNGSINIACPHNFVSRLSGKPRSPDLGIQSFFAMADRDTFDLQGHDGKPMFDRVKEVLGPLGANELYGFEPALIAGGEAAISSVRKLDLQVHLTILRQLAAPSTHEFGLPQSLRT